MTSHRMGKTFGFFLVHGIGKKRMLLTYSALGEVDKTLRDGLMDCFFFGVVPSLKLT